MAILIDTSVFIAYSNTDDVHHEKALKIIKDIVSKKYGNPLISDYIFDEIVTVSSRKTGKKMAINIGNVILDSEIVMIKVDKIIFQDAWAIFQSEENMSFTDCTNIATMRMFNITHIATFDKAFGKIKNIEVVLN